MSTQVGVIIPNTGVLPKVVGIGRMAAIAESAGADSVWVSDHLLMVDDDQRDYPYSADGRPTWDVDVECYEAFVCCSMMAAATRTCRIGTAVLILPQRNVLEVAKAAASLDQLSGGRLVLGVGAGWNASEMNALGYAYKGRGGRFDEMLTVLRDCWTGRPRQFSGDHINVAAGVVLSPRPEQPNGPPLLIGGMTDAAIRRAARLGDGWLALSFASTWNSDMLRNRMAMLQLVHEESRGDQSLQAVLKLHASPAEADLLPLLLSEAVAIGFDEILIELPWGEGIDAAQEMVTAAKAAVTEDREGIRAGSERPSDYEPRRPSSPDAA